MEPSLTFYMAQNPYLATTVPPPVCFYYAGNNTPIIKRLRRRAKRTNASKLAGCSKIKSVCRQTCKHPSTPVSVAQPRTRQRLQPSRRGVTQDPFADAPHPITIHYLNTCLQFHSFPLECFQQMFLSIPQFCSFFGFVFRVPTRLKEVTVRIFAHNCLVSFLHNCHTSAQTVACDAIEFVCSTMASIKTIPRTRLIVP